MLSEDDTLDFGVRTIVGMKFDRGGWAGDGGDGGLRLIRLVL